MSEEASSSEQPPQGPSDEMVSQFLAFTGSADASNAATYLEMSGGDLETAVGLYLEYQGGGGGDVSAGGVAAPPAAGGGPSLPMGNSPEVRAPDETRTMRLMDDVMHGGGGVGAGLLPHPFMGMLQEAEAQMSSSAFAPEPPPRRAADARTAVNNAAAAAQEEKEHDDLDDDEDDEEYEYPNDEDEDDDNDNDVMGVAGPPAPPTLQDMFAPPTHLIHNAGGFQGARAVAKDSRRWLLVNLQRDAEFSCHALNRDVWRDELVENLVREGFIFWQCMDNLPDGQTYAQRYSVMEYPHVAIIDPRTGRLMWRKEGWTQENPMTAESFAEYAMDFCSRHSFDKPPEAPRMSPSGNDNGGVVAVGTSSGEPSTRPTKKRFMTEEEQLQAAMRASLKRSDDDDTDSEMQEVVDDDEVQVVENPNLQQPQQPPISFTQELAEMEVGEEPTDGGARIQIRMPDGKRLVRKFRTDQKVKVIYAFVAQSSEESRGGKEIVLIAGFPPKDLISDVDETIESCGLAGGSINARWK